MKRYLGPSLPMAMLAACLVGCFSLALCLQPDQRVVWADDEAPADVAAEEAAPDESAPEEEVDPNPPTTVKMEEAEWPGLVTIFTGGPNWGEDKGYLTAIAECGFGSVGCTEWQVEEVGEAGMKAYVFLWPHEAATIPAKYADSDAVLCYYYSDRVQPNRWGEWAEYERQSYAGDPRRPAMMTMLARWGNIDQYCNIVRGRAMEYYHYHWDGNRAPEHYYWYMDLYRQASLANNHVPICRLVETRAEDVRKTRQTVFNALAYGTRGFKTGGVGLFNFEDRGERDVPSLTNHGEEALRFNTALNHYSPIFEKARSVDVFQTAPLPLMTKEAPEGYWVRPTGEEIVLGEFNDPESEADDTRWLVLANRDAFNPHEATLHFSSADVSVRLMNKETGEWHDVELTSDGDGKQCVVPLLDGDGELLEVTGGNWAA